MLHRLNPRESLAALLLIVVMTLMLGMQQGCASAPPIDTFNSFGVMSKVKRGDQLAQGHKIQGVPSIAIDGKYLGGGKDFTEQLAIADKLIAKERSEKPGKK